MITPITAIFPALNFPKEVDYPTQEDWAEFSAEAELNYGILSGEWSDKSEEFKTQANNLAQEIQDIGENAINAITFDNIAQLKLNSNMGRVDVLGYYAKGDGGGGIFYWDSTSTEADNGGTIIQATGIATGRWKRPNTGSINVKEFGLQNTTSYSQSDKFTNWLNYILVNSLDGIGANYKIMLSDKINITVDNLVNSKIDFKGLHITVPDDFLEVGDLSNFIIIKTNSLESSISIFNFSIDGSNLTPVNNTDETGGYSTSYAFGGFRIDSFKNVYIKNLLCKGMFYSAGLYVNKFNNLIIDGFIAKDVGGKWRYTQDSTSQYDAAGDAIYLGKAQGNAKAILNNIEANGQVLGRAGVVSEYIEEGSFLEIIMNNCNFDNYHRVIHTEDSGRSKLTWTNGIVTRYSVLHFSFSSTQETNFIFNNIKTVFNAAFGYGASSGLCVYKNGNKRSIFNDCDITYDTASNSVGTEIIYNNCNIIVNSITTHRGGDNISYSECTIDILSGKLYFYRANTSSDKIIFDKCILNSPQHNSSNIHTYKHNLIIKDSISTNVTSNTEGGNHCTYKNSNFLITNSINSVIFLGNSSKKKFINCKIENVTTLALKVYGDGASYISEISNCEFINTIYQLINNKNYPTKVNGLRQVFNTNSTHTSLYEYFNGCLLISNYLLKQEVDTIAIPATSTNIKYSSSWALDSTNNLTQII